MYRCVSYDTVLMINIPSLISVLIPRSVFSSCIPPFYKEGFFCSYPLAEYRLFFSVSRQNPLTREMRLTLTAPRTFACASSRHHNQ